MTECDDGSPERAKHTTGMLFRPFRAAKSSVSQIPRALPWAIELCRFAAGLPAVRGTQLQNLRFGLV